MKYSILFCILTASTVAGAQVKTDTVSKKIRNIAWFTPNGVNQVNGVAIGLQATSVKSQALVINGANIDAGLLAIMAIPYVVAYNVSSKKKKEIGDFLATDSAETIVNGISLSMGGEVAITVNGVNIAGAVTGAQSLNGISLTGFYTRCQRFRGVCISGINNIADKGFGIQVGLFNYCKSLKGLQLGLWNRSGKRGLPIFNWGI